MSTNQPPDLAAIRALWEKLETAPNVVPVVTALAASVPALLDEIDRLRAGIQSIIDNDRSDSWITVDLQTLLG